MSECSGCRIRNLSICASLSDAELGLLSKLGRQFSVKCGQTLMWEGDTEPVVANVIDGVLKLAVNLADGREQIVGMAFPSDFVGRPFGKASPYSVTAMTDAELCVFSRSSFDEFAHDHPELQYKLLQRTLDELDRTREWMMLLGKKTANERIATLLVELSRRLSNEKLVSTANRVASFILPMNRRQMADLLGLTIETVSRQLTLLKLSGVIGLPDRRTVTINDHKELEKRTEAA